MHVLQNVKIVAIVEFKVRPSINVLLISIYLLMVLNGFGTSWSYEWEDNKGINN